MIVHIVSLCYVVSGSVLVAYTAKCIDKALWWCLINVSMICIVGECKHSKCMLGSISVSGK